MIMISECFPHAPAQILESPPVATSVSADAKGGRWCCKAFCFLPPGALKKKMQKKKAQKMPKFPAKIKVLKKHSFILDSDMDIGKCYWMIIGWMKCSTLQDLETATLVFL